MRAGTDRNEIGADIESVALCRLENCREAFNDKFSRFMGNVKIDAREPG